MDPMTMPDVLPRPKRRGIESSPEDRLIVAIRVIQERQRQGLTVKARQPLTSAIGTLRSIESGDKRPTIKLALKIAAVLPGPPGTRFKRDRPRAERGVVPAAKQQGPGERPA